MKRAIFYNTYLARPQSTNVDNCHVKLFGFFPLKIITVYSPKDFEKVFLQLNNFDRTERDVYVFFNILFKYIWKCNNTIREPDSVESNRSVFYGFV